MSTRLKKDPNAVEPFFIVWCSKNGTNDGGSGDTGELQGTTISVSSWTVPDGVTKDSDNKSAISIRGVSYGINTVATIWLSGGTDGDNYALINRITTDDGRTLEKTITIMAREQ